MIIQIIFICSYFETDALFYYKFAQSIWWIKGVAEHGSHIWLGGVGVCQRP